MPVPHPLYLPSIICLKKSPAGIIIPTLCRYKGFSCNVKLFLVTKNCNCKIKKLDDFWDCNNMPVYVHCVLDFYANLECFCYAECRYSSPCSLNPIFFYTLVLLVYSSSLQTDVQIYIRFLHTYVQRTGTNQHRFYHTLLSQYLFSCFFFPQRTTQFPIDIPGLNTSWY